MERGIIKVCDFKIMNFPFHLKQDSNGEVTHFKVYSKENGQWFPWSWKWCSRKGMHLAPKAAVIVKEWEKSSAPFWVFIPNYSTLTTEFLTTQVPWESLPSPTPPCYSPFPCSLSMNPNRKNNQNSTIKKLLYHLAKRSVQNHWPLNRNRLV